MGFFTNIADPIKEVGDILDNLFTSREEILSKEALMVRLKQKLAEKQIELNKVEAQHQSIFVAGWRPAIGWICCLGLTYEFLVIPVLESFGLQISPINIDALYSLVAALLGMGFLRTFEKIKKIR